MEFRQAKPVSGEKHDMPEQRPVVWEKRKPDFKGEKGLRRRRFQGP